MHQIKLLISYVFYIIGDIISKTLMRWGDGYGYSIYRAFMSWSCDLDTNGKIWKYVKNSKKKK